MNAATLSTSKETIPLIKNTQTKDSDNNVISISEIFGPTIQGEGELIGTQTIFIRTAGCDYRCSWCDTGFAVLPEYDNDWKCMDAEAIFNEIEKLSNKQPMWITLSGGNPAMQNLEPLIKLGQSKGYKFSMETQGSISKSWFALLNQLTVSPKPPSSEMRFKHLGLQRCLEACNSSDQNPQSQPDISLKFVVADQNDLIWAKEIANQYPQLPCYVQPCNKDADINVVNPTLTTEIANKEADGNINQREDMLWLIDAVQSLNWNTVKILPQLHTWLWGDKTGV